MYQAKNYCSVIFIALLALPPTLGLHSRSSVKLFSAPGPKVLMSFDRRRFGAVVVSGLACGVARPLSAHASNKGAPGGVVGTWKLTQSGLEEPLGGDLTFERTGEASYFASGKTFPSATNWKVNPGGRFFNDNAKKVEFVIEYTDDSYAYEGFIEDSDPGLIVGTVGRLESGIMKGSFRAELASAADFVKSRPAYAKFEPSPDAPTLELNGRARWQVERERDGGVRPAAPVRNADEQGSVYKNFAGNPAESLSGIMGFH